MNTTKLKDSLNASAEMAKDAAHSAYDTARETGQAVAAEVGARGAEALATARETATARLDDARVALSDTGDQLAETLRRAAEQPENGTLQARVLGGVASGVAVAADRLRGRSLNDLVTDTTAMARRHPGAFAAGAAVAGFAAARFLRSSAKGQAANVAQHQPGSETRS